MAKIRRIIRKLKPAGETPFDEQLWPVNVALLVLGAYLVGIILAVFPLDHPNLLLNAITWLAVVMVAIPLTMWALWYVDNRTLRRGVQLAAVLSLIVNLTIIVIMAMFDLIPVPHIDSPPSKDPIAQRKPVVVPDYNPSTVQRRERPKQDFEKPVETKAPEPEQQEVPHEETSPKDPQTRPELTPIPEPEPSVQPNPIRRTEMSATAPRRSDMKSQISRQLAQAQLRPATPAVTEQVTTRAQRRPTPMQAQAVELERQTTEVQVRQRTIEAEPTVERHHETIKLARRQLEVAPRPDSTSTPTLRRQVQTPRLVPRTAATAVDGEAVARRTSPDALRPTTASATKQAAASVELEQPSVQPVPETPTTVSRQVVTRQNQAERVPTVAQMSTPVTARRTRSVLQPNISTTTATVAATRAPTSSSSPQLRPSSASVSKASSQLTTSNPTLAAADVPSAGAAMQVARSSARRASSSAVPTITPSAAPTSSPSRSTTDAASAVSPVAVASAMAVSSDQVRSRPTPRPARTALSQSFGGTAGIGQSPNLGRGLPTEDSYPARVPSGSARRQRATQTTSGPASDPTSVARISRARAGADVPSATFKAQNVEMATHAGSQVAADLEASATAAITHAGGNQELGATMAAKGIFEVDLGATQIVSQTGMGRQASGGGQPTLNFQAQPIRVERSGVGAGPTVALAANVVAEYAGAPPGEGGGAPSVLEANVEATAATQAEAGGNLPTSGGPSAGDEIGPTEVVSTAGLVGAAEMGRAAIVQASPGIPEAGGGTSSPTRASSGPGPPAIVQAELAAVAGEPESSGSDEGMPLAAQGTTPEQGSTGLLAPPSDNEVGAAAGSELIDAPGVAEPGRVAGLRRASPGREPGPAIADVAFAGGPLRRAATTGLPVGAVEAEQAPVTGAAAPTAEADAVDLIGGVDLLGIDRQAAGAIPISVDAMDGVGGLGEHMTPDVGWEINRAEAGRAEVHFQDVRFIRKRSGGLPGVNVTATMGADAFARQAIRKGDQRGGEPGRPSEKTEESIELGLHFLARHQMSDGSWSLNNFAAAQPQFEEEYVNERAALHSDTAATGLALMAFMGAGYHHKGDQYADLIRNGIDFLVKNQKENGDLYMPLDTESNRSVWLYSQGVATIALCEAYGMTQDPELREPAQKAIQFIIDSQHENRGGWRYSPNYGSDTSVTGWLMMALMSGRLANLDVPDEPFDKISGWLDKAQVSSGQRHLYRYNPFAPDTESQRHGRLANKTMTSVGLLMRLYLGWRRDNEHMIRGADYLMENLPEMGNRRDPKRDTYYWYYATQVMFHMKGKYWEAWNNRLHPMLVDSQIQSGTFAGSWDPRRPVADRWAPHAGRIYVTTMNLLSLEVYYRHLPIYEDTLD
jgi:hypothetical protein